MSHHNLTSLPADFTGVVRLFPLPGAVLFPHVVQPLHIFEPRYCDMLEDALATDRLITMALLQPGWEKDYEGRPPLEEIACIGKVVSHARLPENRHNLLLLGLRRARIKYELPVSAAFRKARVELLGDESHPSGAALRGQVRARLIELFRQIVPQTDTVEEQLDQLLSQDVELGMLVDIVAFTANLDVQIKQQLLAETNVDRRANALTRALEMALKRPESLLPRSRSDWPPPFSKN